MTSVHAAVKRESSMQVSDEDDGQNDSQDDEEQRVNFSSGEDDGQTTTGQPFTFSHLPVGMMGGMPGMNPMQQLMGFGGGGSMGMMNPAMMMQMQMMMAGGMGMGGPGGGGMGSGMHPSHTAANASLRLALQTGSARPSTTNPFLPAHTAAAPPHTAAAINLVSANSSAAPSSTSTNPSLRSTSSPTHTTSNHQQQHQQPARHAPSASASGGTVTGTPIAEFAQQWQMQQQQQSAMYCWWQQQMYMTNMYAASSGSFSAMQGPAAAATFSSMPPAVQEMMHKMSASNSMLAASGLAHSAAAATGGSLNLSGAGMPPWMLAATAAGGGGSNVRAGQVPGVGTAAVAGGSDGSDDDDEHGDDDGGSPGRGIESSGMKRCVGGGVLPGSPVPKRGRRCTKEQKICKNCFTVSTPFWRKDKNDGKPLCNACGLYFSKNDAPRPKLLWKNDEQQQGQGLVIGANGVAMPAPCNAGSNAAYTHDAATQLSQLQQSALQHMQHQQHQQMMMFSQQRASGAVATAGAMMGSGGVKAVSLATGPQAAAMSSRPATGLPNILARPTVPAASTQSAGAGSSQVTAPPQSTIQAMVQKAKQQHQQQNLQHGGNTSASASGSPSARSSAPSAGGGLAPTVAAMAKANAAAAPRGPAPVVRASPFTAAAGNASTPSFAMPTNGKPGMVPFPPFSMNPLMGPLGLRPPLPGLMSPAGANAIFAGLGMPLNMQAMAGMPNMGLLPKHLFPSSAGMHLPPPTLSAMLAAATAAAVAAGQPPQPGQQQPSAGSAATSMQASMFAAFTNATQNNTFANTTQATAFLPSASPHSGSGTSFPFPPHHKASSTPRANALTTGSAPSSFPLPSSAAAVAASEAHGNLFRVSDAPLQHSNSQPAAPAPIRNLPLGQQQQQQQLAPHQQTPSPISMWLHEQQTQPNASAAAPRQPSVSTAGVAVSAMPSSRSASNHTANDSTLNPTQISLWAPLSANLAHPLA